MIEKIAQKSSFESMEKKPLFQMPKPKDLTPKAAEFKFFRKGKVGDWQNYFNEHQNAYIQAEAKKYFEPLGLHFKYE